ncbi:cytosine-specific methyltransferase [Clostridium tetani]|uniref:DNA (cytosine-5-)-methyltransferase n=1 Tax=Clostridium tetani TaxID=1513 RepID=UPI002953D12F|nr:DNA (cytosine-5-)-methyltransferase [Clostridium tetani]BDR73131.1 cytosine-specific methyltransferase [Clostridium tetani]
MKDLVIDKEKVRSIMREKNIKSQTELSKLMGITKNQLSLILSNKFDPIKSNVRLLCDTLKVDFNEIVKKEDIKSKNLKQISFLPENKEDKYLDVQYSNIKPDRQYNAVELFAGAGGLALGLEKAGFTSVGLVELDKYCCKTLKINRPKWNIINEDIVRVAENGIRKYVGDVEVDLLSGGYPCQAFSYAGKKLGLNDVRGTLFYYYAEILSQLKPKVFLAENVKGLVSHDGGKTLKTMIGVFEEIGYKAQYEVLNAVNYGVAQKRQRIVIIGIRKDLEHKFEYKYPKNFDYIPTLKDALKDVPKSEGTKYPEKKKKVLELVPPGGYWRDLPDEIAKEYMGKSYFSGGGRTGMARRIGWHEPCLTLTCSPAQKQTERCHPDETRPFTTREYARIQSFPDEWNFHGSIGQIYKQIGNAVPVNLAKAVGLSIVEYLNKI